jgi:hypothetical protein
MGSIKKVSLALCVSVAMLTAAPTVMAKPAGKIENATPAATVIAIDETLELAEETLKMLQSGDVEKDVMMKQFKTLKQRSKQIESTVTYMLREKALGRLGKARLAYKKGKDAADVEALMVKSLDTFKNLKQRYHGFSGD